MLQQWFLIPFQVNLRSAEFSNHTFILPFSANDGDEDNLPIAQRKCTRSSVQLVKTPPPNTRSKSSSVEKEQSRPFERLRPIFLL